jgi:hypothetical protein
VHNPAVDPNPTEKLRFMVEGEYGLPVTVDPTDLTPASTATADAAAATVPRNAMAVLHGHIDGRSAGFIDETDPNSPYARGDSQALQMRRPIPNYPVSNGRVGVQEVVNGRLQFRTVTGELSHFEGLFMQLNLNRKQALGGW